MDLGTLSDDIPLDTARLAHRGTSLVPDERAIQERNGYAQTLSGDYARLAQYADTDDKCNALAQEFARYRQGYRLRYIELLHAMSRCMSTMVTGGSNFPVALNRKRGNTADKRRDELIEYRKSALAAIEKVLRPELRPIMAGDDDAIERLQAKLDAAVALQKRMTDANAAIRWYADAGQDTQISALRALGFTDVEAGELLTPDFCKRIGFADFSLRNNNKEIHRLRDRLETVQRAKATPDTEFQGANARYHDVPPENRVRLYFPAKPAPDVLARLKRAAFRWAPSLDGKPWQAMRNPNSLAVARELAGEPCSGL